MNTMPPVLPLVSLAPPGTTGSRERRTGPGFTLIEIVIALTIVAVITAAAIPSVRGMIFKVKHLIQVDPPEAAQRKH